MAIFPLNHRIQWDSVVRVSFNTAQIRNNGGHVTRIARWSSALRAWPLDLAEMTDSEWVELQDFFIQMKGPFQAFEIVEPITDDTYEAHFVEDALEIAWRFFDGSASDGLLIEQLRPDP